MMIKSSNIKGTVAGNNPMKNSGGTGGIDTNKLLDLVRRRDPAGLTMLSSEDFRNLPADQQDQVIRAVLASTMNLDAAVELDKNWGAAIFGAIMTHFADPTQGGLQLQPRTMQALEDLAAALSTAIPTMDAMEGLSEALLSSGDAYNKALADHVSGTPGSQTSPAEYLANQIAAIHLMSDGPASSVGTRTPGSGSIGGDGVTDNLLSFLSFLELNRNATLDGLMAGGELSETALAGTKLELDRLSSQLDTVLGVLRDIGEHEKKRGQIFQG